MSENQYSEFIETVIRSSGLTSYLSNYDQIREARLEDASLVFTSSSGVQLEATSSNNSSSVSQIAKDLLELNRGVYSERVETQSISSAVQAQVQVQSESNSRYLSRVEEAILRSSIPIELNESEEITVNGQRGVWANRAEVINWRGVIPITEYLINQDENPEVITKKVQQQLEYIQELAIRYLRPPTPPAPGEIIINQQANVLTPPAPPLIVRQQPPRPATPEPLVIREVPPQAPAQVGRKVITISGKRIPPPPRKVIIERLAQLPSKPQSVLIERWLPYAEVKRRVIFNKPTQPDPVVVKPRNIVVQWEAPNVNVKKEYKYLGVIRANPVDYVQRYSTSLIESNKLPQFVLDIKTPEGLVLASDYKYNSLHELYGDVQALRLVNLETEGLSQYAEYLQKYLSENLASNRSSFNSTSELTLSAAYASQSLSLESNSAITSVDQLSLLIEQIFNSINRDNNGRISVEDAEKVLLRLNSRLGRRYGEDDVKAFFQTLDNNSDGSIDLQEFKKAFLNVRF